MIGCTHRLPSGGGGANHNVAPQQHAGAHVKISNFPVASGAPLQ